MTTTTLNAAPAAPAPALDGPRAILRLEALGLLVGAVTAYALLGGSWLWFAVFLLVPDVSMVGYLVGPKVGAVLYNVGHSTLGPLLLLGGALILGLPQVFVLAAVIWLAHIGMDRTFGYGLKYGSRFTKTHLTG